MDARKVLVAYDVSDDKRRANLSKLLSSYGDRLQYSLFQLVVRPVQLELLCRSIEGIIVSSIDSVLIFDLGKDVVADGAFNRRIGATPELIDSGPLVI